MKFLVFESFKNLIESNSNFIEGYKLEADKELVAPSRSDRDSSHRFFLFHIMTEIDQTEKFFVGKFTSNLARL